MWWRLRTLASRLRGLVAGPGADAELDTEIEEHLRSLAERFVSRGMPPEAAEYAARRQFGNITKLRENHYDARGMPLIENCVRDLRFGLRLLRQKLAFSIIAVSILALGIGASTAVYSVAKGVVFGALPFPRPERLALIFEGDEPGERFQPGNLNLSSVRPGTFQDWREQLTSFESMAACQGTQATIMEGDRALVIYGFQAGEGFFETLGVPARLGRHLNAADYSGNGGSVVVLGDRMWREQYNADPAIIGRQVLLDGASHQVVGVMPPAFLPTTNGNDPQFWIPL